MDEAGGESPTPGRLDPVWNINARETFLEFIESWSDELQVMSDQIRAALAGLYEGEIPPEACGRLKRMAMLLSGDGKSLVKVFADICKDINGGSVKSDVVKD